MHNEPIDDDARRFEEALDRWRRLVIDNALRPDAFHVSREREQHGRLALLNMWNETKARDEATDPSRI